MTSKTTGEDVASIGARGMKKPGTLTPAEIKSVCASVVAQTEAQTANRDGRLMNTIHLDMIGEPLASATVAAEDRLGEDLRVSIAEGRVVVERADGSIVEGMQIDEAVAYLATLGA